MYKVLDSSSLEWDDYIEKLSVEKRDIYLTREYVSLYETNGDGLARLFIYEDGNNIAVYPFLLRQIQGYRLDICYYDIESAYGYSGPIVSDEMNGEFLSNFEELFCKYCKEYNIVAEFIRFNPYIKNENIFKKNISVIKNRTTVCLNLDKTVDEIWKDDINSKTRNMIRKAEKLGLHVEIKNDYKSFKDIYEETMKKVSADSYYYFKPSYYINMEGNSNFSMFNVKFGEDTVASAVFMTYGEYFHYHLAGSKKEYLSFAPNNLLLWEAIKYANKNGYKLFHFGGGVTNSSDDNLFKFKSSFSKDRLDFYIGKRVHNPKIYDFLIKEWEKRKQKESELLLRYRII